MKSSFLNQCSRSC